MKIISWNVNGLQAAWGYGLLKFMEEQQADIYAFQETKLHSAFKPAELAGYLPFWSFSKSKRGYSGTLCLTKSMLLSVVYDMGNVDNAHSGISVDGVRGGGMDDDSGSSDGGNPDDGSDDHSSDGGNPDDHTDYFDCEGRLIILEYPAFYFVNCYVPNSQGSSRRYDFRCEWDRRFIRYIRELEARKPVIVCGDFNVAISDDDIYPENK